MSDILIYDKDSGAGKQILRSVNTPDYLKRDDVMVLLPEDFKNTKFEEAKFTTAIQTEEIKQTAVENLIVENNILKAR